MNLKSQFISIGIIHLKQSGSLSNLNTSEVMMVSLITPESYTVIVSMVQDMAKHLLIILSLPGSVRC